MALSEVLQKPHDFFCDLNCEFEKAAVRMCKQELKEGRLSSAIEDYLAKFMFANMVFSLGLKFYFLPLKRLGQSLEGNYSHDN